MEAPPAPTEDAIEVAAPVVKVDEVDVQDIKVDPKAKYAVVGKALCRIARILFVFTWLGVPHLGPAESARGASLLVLVCAGAGAGAVHSRKCKATFRLFSWGHWLRGYEKWNNLM